MQGHSLLAKALYTSPCPNVRRRELRFFLLAMSLGLAVALGTAGIFYLMNLQGRF